MFLPKHDFSQLVVLNKIFLHKQVVPLHLQILAMYFLVYSTEGQSILYCCLSDYMITYLAENNSITDKTSDANYHVELKVTELCCYIYN